MALQATRARRALGSARTEGGAVGLRICTTLLPQAWRERNGEKQPEVQFRPSTGPRSTTDQPTLQQN